MIKIITTTINNCERKNLAEGRDSGMAFAFCKKISDEEYQLVSPMSPCKDFLNDNIFCEKTGHNLEIYGMKDKKYDIFDEHAYLCISMMDNIYSKNPIKDLELLKSRFLIMQNMINDVEKRYDLEDRTEISLIEDNLAFVRLPLFWVETTWQISLYTLLLRVFLLSENTMDYVKYLKKAPYSADSIMIDRLVKKSSDMFFEFTKQEFIIPKDRLQIQQIHNCGIMEYIK
jgi:hypothetical protein